jgi:bis(5'-nucleosidyl)-tetraphosphatase
MKSEIKSCGFLLFRQNPTGAASQETSYAERSFLLMRHADRWDLPKGHVDPGESEMETALRELHEETGIDSRSLLIDESFRFEDRYLVRLRGSGEKLHEKKLVIFIADLVHPVEIRATEHESWEWIPWSPPHAIQSRTIDPLLAAVNAYWMKVRS